VTQPAGTRLGPYEILAPLGAGGMGEVYRARDTRLGREVAIKVLPDHLARDPDSLARFEREARAVAALAHPNILDIHDIGSESGFQYLVTELLEGESLRQRLTGSPLPWRTAVEIGLAVADGLASAHAHGIVHRDLKPENVFLTFDGRVKILDFGLARLEPKKSTESSPTIATPTRTGTVMGTAGYMSPEQARGGHADPRSDIFSLGCILYEMATGKRAFFAGNAAETLVAILRDEPRDPGDLVPDLPDHLRLVILRCLAKYPDSRFESARDLAFALKVAGTESARSPLAPPAKRRLARPIFLLAGAAAVTVLLISGVRAWFHRDGRIDSLAVLPFTNASQDPNAEYLSAGITESVINNLLQLRELRVIPRASVFEYKGERDPLKAGRALDVRAVLTGKVTQVGDSLVVQAELTDVKRGTELWGKRFEARLSDAFEVQENIAQEILKSLRLRLSGGDEERVAKRYTEDAEAYKLYLKGRLYWNRRTDDSIEKSIGFFQEAIARDPRYALAYAGLADSYLLVAFYGALPPKEVLPKAREAAMRALEIDRNLAEGHALLADLKYQFEWDWTGAEREFRRAIELNPNYSTAHQWYANYLAVLGRTKEACVEILRAENLDPLNPVISMDVGHTCYYTSGDYRKAIEQYRKVLELNPDFVLAHFYLGLAHVRRNDLADAVSEIEIVKHLAPGQPDPIALLGYTYGIAGRRAEAEQALAELKSLSKRRYVSAFPLVWVYVGLGDRDRAFEWLEKAYEERAGRIVYVYGEPAFNPLRSDPRFRDLLRRLNLPA
jgi:serine/threonine protein kinase/tetratricopeptide (TPR) repeat protein